jgi:hypothetical protein
MPIHLRNLVGTIVGITEKVVLVACTLLFKFFGQNWIIALVPGVIIIFISAILTTLLIDSPQFHYDRGNLKKGQYIF